MLSLVLKTHSVFICCTDGKHRDLTSSVTCALKNRMPKLIMILKILGYLGFVPFVALLFFFIKLFYSLWDRGPSGISSIDVLGLGFSFLTWSLWIIIFFIFMKTLGHTTSGKVVSFSTSGYNQAFNNLGETNPQQSAVIEFETESKEKFTFTSPYSDSSFVVIGSRYQVGKNLNVGDSIEIIYDPQNPNRAIENRLALPMWTLAIFALGAALIVIGLRVTFPLKT